MNTAWQIFLQTIGATEHNGDSAFVADPAALTALDGRDVIMPLSPYGVLGVEGAGAEKFLQGQLTCHVAETSPTLSTPGAYCTPKGRMVCSFQLARPSTDHFLLRMRRDLLDVASATLQKYIVFSKAKQQRIDDMFVIGLHGPNTGAMVREFAGDIPGGKNRTLIHGEAVFIQRDADGTWFEYWAPSEQALLFWNRYYERCTAAGSRYWRWADQPRRRSRGVRCHRGSLYSADAELPPYRRREFQERLLHRTGNCRAGVLPRPGETPFDSRRRSGCRPGARHRCRG